MNIEVVDRSGLCSEALAQYATRRLSFALDRFRDSIAHIRLRLLDLNGPKGGQDKECQLVISIPRSKSIILKNKTSDIYAAIDCVAERAKRQITNIFEKRTSGRRLTNYS